MTIKGVYHSNKSVFMSRKDKTMLAIPMTKRTTIPEIGQDTGWATYLPSPLLLQLVIENGWKVVKTELAPSEDQNGFVYLVTFKSDACPQNQHLILPRTTLIEKILNEHLNIRTSLN